MTNFVTKEIQSALHNTLVQFVDTHDEYNLVNKNEVEVFPTTIVVAITSSIQPSEFKNTETNADEYVEMMREYAVMVKERLTKMYGDKFVYQYVDTYGDDFVIEYHIDISNEF